MKKSILKTCKPNVFISYRTSDTGLIVPRIALKLKKTIEGTIFWDKLSLEPGIDYRPQIQSKIKECNYALIIIGENWYLKDPEKLKESDEVDYFKIELEGLLDRAEKDKLAVTPVLIDKAGLPSKSNIPPEILQLIFNHRFELNSGVDFDHHMNKLSKKIKEHLKCRIRKVFKFLLPFLTICILALSYLFIFNEGWPLQRPDPDTKTTQEPTLNNSHEKKLEDQTLNNSYEEKTDVPTLNISCEEKIEKLRKQYPSNNIAIIILKTKEEVVLGNFLGIKGWGNHMIKVTLNISKSPAIRSINVWGIKSITINPQDEVIKNENGEFLKATFVSFTNEESEWYILAPLMKTFYGKSEDKGIEILETVKLRDVQHIFISKQE